MTTIEKTQVSLEKIIEAMKLRAEEILTEEVVGKHFEGEPWSEELFEITMQTIVNITINNTNITNFNIDTSVEKHLLLMNVKDEFENTVANVVFFSKQDDTGYTIDGVKVVYKIGAFVAERPEVNDELPF